MPANIVCRNLYGRTDGKTKNILYFKIVIMINSYNFFIVIYFFK